ncbi:putative acetyltransferase [Aureobasidium subglaciale]|nr:putative acetyltransferase [Aureobasidium subglaciale]
MVITPEQKRIDLRLRSQSDAEALFPTMSHPDSMQYWSRGPVSNIEELRKDFAPDDMTGWKIWAIVKAGEDDAIGFVAACSKRKGVSEIGYIVAREVAGYGYGREAVSLLIERLFAEGQRRIFADVDPDNARSIALLKALGFKLEGRLRAERETHIGIRDSLVYGLLAEEWQSATPK